MFSACKNDVILSEEWSFADHKWINGDAKKMIIHAPDTSRSYKLDLLLKHDDSFGYQNLYIRTNTTYPSGKKVSSVTSLELINPDGSWAGDCGSSCHIELPLQTSFTFPEPGDYEWTVEPYMRMDTVAGIKSLTVLCRQATK